MTSTRLLVAVTLLLLCRFSRGETVYRITGTVVSARDGSPVPHCRIRATPSVEANAGARGGGREGGGFAEGQPFGISNRGRGASGGQANDAVDADERGRFSVTVAHAGAWRVTATARGFRAQAYDEHEGFSSAVVLTAAAPTMALQFRVTPDSEITGTVLDEASEPVRGAQVTLQRTSLNTTNGLSYGNAGNAVTDDRGRYELGALAPGEYRIRVQGRPWYAANQTGQGVLTGASSVPSLDPSLDVVYAPVWYPGTTDSAQASSILLRGGEEKVADFHLVPIPSVHLRISVPQTESTGGFQNSRGLQITPVSEDGLPGGAFGLTVTRQEPGVVEYSGLSPGLYQVQRPGEPSSKPALIQVTATSPVTLSLADTVPTVPLALTLDGLPRQERRRIYLQDSISGRRYTLVADRFRGREPRAEDDAEETSLDLPPGKYRIGLVGSGNAYLTGLEATGTKVTGKSVDVESGTPHLTLHFSTGTAIVSGFVRRANYPCAGALVLLVPAALGDPENMVPVARDQSNTDGSFLIRQVVPGRYILLALDNGWDVNWRDPSTLARYLLQGIPVEVSGDSSLKRDVEAQQP